MKISRKVRNISIAGLIVIIVSMGFVSSTDKDFNIVKNLDIFYSLFRELNVFYVDETDPEKLIETGIDAMLSSLDPYTTYIPESEMDDFDFMTTGNYGGIGALIRQDNNYVIIADPYAGSPAAKAGLMGGDIIISVDGYNTKNKEISQVSERLKGTPGTEVTLEVKKLGKEKTEKVKIKREQIHINNVSYYGKIDDKTGYIRLSNFTLGAGQEVKDALVELKEKEGIEKLVLDLRGNPGGLVIEAIRTCNLFLDKGQLIVYTKGKVKQWDQEYYTQSPAYDTKIPIVVLVSSGSASAAEIVAGALQDLDRAVIFGQRTFGKGLVQSTRKLSYNGQLKLTTAKYYIPSNRCIQALDYSHRNEDGSVGHIPDSLISEFATKNGRIVYDGGGITPDVNDSIAYLSQIAINLYAQGLIFDYASEYISQNPVKPEGSDFSITDKDFEQFKNFVASKDFKFETRSESTLDGLIAIAKREKYYDLAKDEFKALSKKLQHENNKDMELFKAEILPLINEEIYGRYYYQEGRIGLSLKNDEQVARAAELLKDEAGYNKILSPVEKEM
jgi:carboxyl-terminal processing protease